MEVKIGVVTHYYNRIEVAVLSLVSELQVGETIHFLGHSTDFHQPVGSMEIDHQKVQLVKPGDEVAIKVEDRVRKGDKVFRIIKTEG